MNMTELAEEVARRVDSSIDEAHGFIAEAMDLLVELLNRGEEVSIRGLGTFKWVMVPEKLMYDFHTGTNKLVPVGFKLRFVPAAKFSTRRRKPNDRAGWDDQTGSGYR